MHEAASTHRHDHGAGHARDNHNHDHDHGHSHAHDHAHALRPVAAVSPHPAPWSLVRLSLVARLGLAAGLSVLVWAAALLALA
jgi:hypothetical protein